MPDRVHQVRLAETDAAVDEQRVVRPRRRLRHRAAGRMRELVRRTDDEGVEGVAGSEPARRRPRRLVQARGRRRGPAPATARAAGIGSSVTNGRRSPCRSTSASASLEDGRVVLGQPVPEERVRHPDAQRAAVVGHEDGRLEPGVEAVPVDLGLDAGKDLVPDVAASHVSKMDRSSDFRPPEPVCYGRFTRTATRGKPLK